MFSLPLNYFNDNTSSISLEQLQQLQGWQARYKQLVQWGKLLSKKPELQVDDFRVRGCDTAAWIACIERDQCQQFALYADSKIIRGLAALLLSQIQGKTRDQLKQLDIEQLLEELDLKSHLSPSRSNGFLALSKRALTLAEQT